MFVGNIFDPREWIEDSLEGHLGYFLSLQEEFDEEDRTLEVRVHSDSYEENEEPEIEHFEFLGLSEHESLEVISTILNIDISFSHYENEG